MPLNWSLEVVLSLFAIGSTAAGIYVTLSAIHHGTRNRYFAAMACAWSLIEVTFILESLSVLFLSPELYLLSWYSFSALGFFFLIMSDSLSRDSIDPVKLVLFFAIITIAIVVAALTMNVQEMVFVYTLKNGSRTIYWNEKTVVFNYLIYFWPRLPFYYNSARMVRDAPKILKKQGKLMLFGVILGDSSFVAYMQLKLVAPGISYISLGIGIFLITIIVARHPKLMYILPFRAIRLTVIDTRSGIPLFNHSWKSDRDTETVDIYAGMIHGVNLFIKESLNKGNVQEIRTEDAVIFAHRSTQYPVACMLVATKSSRVLRDALKTFAEKFYARYAPHFSNTSETGAFESATTFVAESFPFIPDYSAPP